MKDVSAIFIQSVSVYFRCMKDVSAGVSKLLGFVGSIKGLSTIRDAVWDQLHQVNTVFSVKIAAI